MTSMQALLPDGWPRPSGYANGAVVSASGRLITLAGQIGWDPVTSQFNSDDFAEQVGTILRNIVTLLHAAHAEPRHLIRLTWFITDKDAYLRARRDIGALYREIIGAHYPPMSVVVVDALIEDRALVEIEATAMVPTG